MKFNENFASPTVFEGPIATPLITILLLVNYREVQEAGPAHLNLFIPGGTSLFTFLFVTGQCISVPIDFECTKKYI